MDRRLICTSCMSGMLEDGACSHCGARAAGQADRPRAALPDRQLLCADRYYLGRVLGFGGYGITYLALDMRQRRKVAIKEFYPKQLVTRQYPTTEIVVSNGPEDKFRHAKMRFEQEARILHELHDIPEIIDVYHLFEENGTAYYVMEYLEGMDLKTFLRRNGVQEWRQIQKPVGMILRALYHIHKKQLIHRDISPDNIFILPDGGAKLIDFGNARNYLANTPLTTILKVRFAPIEQYQDGKEQGPWTDIYSMSATIYYSLTGKFPADSQRRLIAMESGSDPVEPLSAVNPAIPRHVSDAVQRGMELFPEDRYQTVGEFWSGLFPGQPLLLRGKVCILRCVGGIMNGLSRRLSAGEIVHLGRSRDATIIYPSESPGISRAQCSFAANDRNELYVRDNNSSYGTMLNGRRLIPMRWYKIGKNDLIGFAGEKYRVFEEN